MTARRLSYLLLALAMAYSISVFAPGWNRPGATPAMAQGDWAWNVNLLTRVAFAEARAEPYVGRVAVGAVIINRTRDPRFPDTIPGVIFQPGAFESVSIGSIWWWEPDELTRRAALDAINGWDPTGGAVYFWNPAGVGGWSWIWSRNIITQIGRHVFAR